MRDCSGVIGAYHLGKVLKVSAEKLGERCGKAAIEILSRRFEECTGAPENDQHSYLWRSAIEEHEQDLHKDRFQFVLVDAIRDSALGLSYEATEESRQSIRSLLQSPYPTLVRIGIYVCGERYGNVGDVFWECVKSEWFVEKSYWHELFWFIKKAFSRFSSTDRATFLRLVGEVRGDWGDKSRQAEWDECHQRDLLHPAVGQGDKEVDEKYQDLVNRRGQVQDHPDFYSYSTVGSVENRGPIEPDALVRMDDGELLTLMRDFVPDSRAWNGPTYSGFAESISAAVRASEDGFAKRMKIFIDVPRSYQHGLLKGLKGRWAEDKQEIDWDETLSFMWSIVQSETFKDEINAETTGGWEPSVHWVITDISDLIKAGSSNAQREIELDKLQRCVEIIQRILSVTVPTKAGENEDAVSHAINSPRGRAIEALINVALAMRRYEAAHPQNSGLMWATVEPILDSELSLSESGNNEEFAALAGIYCPNLHYLSARWVEENFNRLFSLSNDFAWNCAAQGFAYQRYVYDWLYTRLRDAGHLRRMIFTEALPDSVAEKALQFLGLAYLDGLENLDQDGLMDELIVNLKDRELSQLSWFLWTLRSNKENLGHRVPRILEFWRRVAGAIRESDRTMADLQSQLNLLAEFIDEITPELKQVWIEAAPYAQVRHHGYILVEHLARLSSAYPEEVAAVFRAALSGFLPDYQREDVISCVMQLAESGHVDDAEWLCNEYAEQGSILLKETYELIRANNRSSSASGDGESVSE